MGIPQLLPFLESATEPKHISAFRGQKCAIDGYAWLHKASMTCAMEMARGTPTRKFVDFCMKLLNMIRSHGVEPTAVTTASLVCRLTKQGRAAEAIQLFSASTARDTPSCNAALQACNQLSDWQAALRIARQMQAPQPWHVRHGRAPCRSPLVAEA